jgi:peptide-methionine (S)-S-oxide reductase
MFRFKTKEIITVDDCLPGSDAPLDISGVHAVNGRSFIPPYEEGLQSLRVGMGCFWGAERLFWQIEGVWVTAVGYAGGVTKNPTYQEVCSGYTAHTEVVQVVYSNKNIELTDILKTFWESHDPTQGMRQGNDSGTQYRSALYLDDELQLEAALKSREVYQDQLEAGGMGQITTEIRVEPVIYFAEEDHQQYLHKNPGGYCNLRGTGISCVA